jgi:hypothetical protein
MGVTPRVKRFAGKVDYIPTPWIRPGWGCSREIPFHRGRPCFRNHDTGNPEARPCDQGADDRFLLPVLQRRGDENQHGLDLKVSQPVTVTPEPAAEELEVLHAVDVTNVLKRK